MLDHLVVGASDLAAGADWMAGRLGVAPGGFGRHAAMGTRNALWRLEAGPAAGPTGAAYLEVIAVDPAAPAPGRPRWFGLDEPATRARLARGPRLLTWQVRPALPLDEAIAALRAAGGEPGEPMALARDDLAWRLSVPADGVMPMGGRVPVLIEWADGTTRPPERLPRSGLRLAELRLGAAEGLGAALAAIGADRLVALDAPGAILAAMETPAGRVVLD
jgi:hypothetical protein